MPTCPQCNTRISFMRASNLSPFRQLIEADEIVEEFNTALEAEAERRLQHGKSGDSVVLRDTRRLKKTGSSLRSTWHAYLHKEYNAALPFSQSKEYLAEVDALLALHADIVNRQSG